MNFKRQLGFTLLEMMLTVGLIALTATYVSLNIGQSDAKLANLEAKRFVAMINLAQDESILTAKSIKLIIDVQSKQYYFEKNKTDGFDIFSIQKADSDLGDKPIQQHDLLSKPITLPRSVALDFTLKEVENNLVQATRLVPNRVHEILNETLFDQDQSLFVDDKKHTTILIEPNGIISPFSLTLSVNKIKTTVALDRFGKARIKDAK